MMEEEIHAQPAERNVVHVPKLVKCCLSKPKQPPRHPQGTLPYMGYIGMCRCEGYGFQAVYSRIGYINQRVWV